MPPAFNLIDEPFLPCLRPDGSRVESSLRGALVNAHEFAELRDESPLATAALHRLLLAVLHRAYDGPKSKADRVAVLAAGRFDPARVSAYLEAWRGRFDLFDGAHPFYQTAGFRAATPSPVNRLAQELARGNNAALFDHTTDDTPVAVAPPAAARLLVAEQAYAVGGGQSDAGNTTHATLVAGATVLARGGTLFETLCYNLTVYDGDSQPFASEGDDLPAWESPPGCRTHEQSPEPAGYLDYLTWQARSLRLHPEEDGGGVVVRRVSYAQGRAFKPSGNFFDPMKAYRRDEKLGYLPVRFTEQKALWRDSFALFQFAEADQFRGPTTLSTLAALPGDAVPRSRRCRVSLFGLCSDKAKVNFWRHETLPLPLEYLDDRSAVGRLEQGLRLAEDAGKEALRRAAWSAASEMLSNHEGSSPDRDRVSRLVAALAPERRYWAALERPFREYMGAFASGEGSLGDWFFAAVRPAALGAFEATFGRLDRKWEAKAVTQSRLGLRSSLRALQAKYRVESRPAKGGPP